MVEVARSLLGCTVEYGRCSGIVVETEAYHDREPACHAHVGRTPRTVTLFGAPGRAYVYRSYGIHLMLNAVCEASGIGAAVLIRALEPDRGVAQMRQRRGLTRVEDLCSGPGKLAQALGIALADNGCDLAYGPVRIREPVARWRSPPIAVGSRIGITKAVDLPWRFAVAGHPCVSAPRLPRPAHSSPRLATGQR